MNNETILQNNLRVKKCKESIEKYKNKEISIHSLVSLLLLEIEPLDEVDDEIVLLSEVISMEIPKPGFSPFLSLDDIENSLNKILSALDAIESGKKIIEDSEGKMLYV